MEHIDETFALVPAPPAHRLARSVKRLLRNRHQYNDLQTLPDHLLQDIGLSRWDVKKAVRSNRLL